MDAGQDLVRRELHRAPGERWIGPVVTGIEQRAERADLVPEFENPVCDSLRSPRDHQTLEQAPGRELRIRLTGKVAHHVKRAGLRKLGLHDMEVERVRAVLAMRIAARRGLVISDEDAARHTPSGGIGREARGAPAFQVALNLSPDDVRPT